MPQYFPHGHASFMTPKDTELEAQRAKAREQGTLAVRADGFCYEILSEAEREQAESTGRPKALAIRCTSLCSKEHYIVRLNTAEEEAQGKAGRRISPRRKEVQQLFEAAFPDRNAVPDPAALPDDAKPVFRLDRAQALTNPDGTPRVVASRDGAVRYTLLRCAWISPYLPYTDRAGVVTDPREHMECSHFSTINVSLTANTGDGFSHYYQLCTKTIEEAAASGESSFFKACARAAAVVTNTWNREMRTCPEAKLGNFTVTTWYPEEHIQIPLDGSMEEAGEALYRFFSDPLFAMQVRDGMSVPGACSPECLIRFINNEGELCGSWRVRPWHLCTKDQNAMPEEDRLLDRTSILLRDYVQNIDPRYRQYKGIAAVDILPGRCFRASHMLVKSRNPAADPANVLQVRNLLFMALSQGRSLAKEPRLNLGSCQAFVTRTNQEYVTSVSSLRDGAMERNTACLMPEGGRLEPSAEYREELDAELFRLRNLEYLMQESRQESPQGNMSKAYPEAAMPAAENGRDPSPDASPYASADASSDDFPAPCAGM